LKIHEGQSREAKVGRRYAQLAATHSISDVYDVLVEMITNADDSYGRQFRGGCRSKNGGDILVEHCARRGKPSSITVRDRAEGMDSEKMQEVIYNIGEFTSDEGDRGFMGRGVKDCTSLGDLTFESISEDRYYKCSLTSSLVFTNEVDGRKVTTALRDRLGIPHRNGTSVTLKLKPGKSLPRFESLVEILPDHYALRRILAPDSDSRVLMVKTGSTRQERVRLVHHRPRGELVLEESFEIDAYKGAEASLRIWRVDDPLDDHKEGYRFERYGIIISGERGVYECSTLLDSLRGDHHTRLFYGELTCPHIDRLLSEYEKARLAKAASAESNDTILVDPNRKSGLNRQHPFTQQLLRIAIARYRELLDAEKEREKSHRQEIESDSTRRCLDRLARLASEFMDASDAPSLDSVLDSEAFSSRAFFLYPEKLNVGVSAERPISIYVKKDAAQASRVVSITCDEPDSLSVSPSSVELHDHKKRADLLIGSFSVSGKAICPAVVVTATLEDGACAEAILGVVEIENEDWNFSQRLEFERAKYEVRVGKSKTLRLLALNPELVGTSTKAEVWVSGKGGVAVVGSCTLKPVPGTNYAEGRVRIRGDVLKARAQVVAKVAGHTAEAVVRVVEREKQGPPVRITLVAEDYVTTRAKWADDKQQPNLLMIGAKHRALAHHMGSEADDFPGQDTPLGRALIAEVVAESVCRRGLVRDALSNPGKFRWGGLADTPAILAESVLVEYLRRMSKFLTQAHPIALRDIPNDR